MRQGRAPKNRGHVMLEDLKGKRALITGSSTGIGAAVARELARLGVAVVIHGNKSADAANALGEEIGGGGGVVLGDVGDGATAQRIVEEAVEGAGRARHPHQQCRGDPRAGDQCGVRRGDVRAGVRHQCALGAGGDQGGLSAPQGGGRRLDHQYRLDRRTVRRLHGIDGLCLGQGGGAFDHPQRGAGIRRRPYPGQRGGAGVHRNAVPRRYAGDR